MSDSILPFIMLEMETYPFFILLLFNIVVHYERP